MDDDKNLFPLDEVDALPAPPRSLYRTPRIYRTQTDGDLVRPAQTPLWSDERIDKATFAQRWDYEQVATLLRQMRDEYEAALAAATYEAARHA